MLDREKRSGLTERTATAAAAVDNTHKRVKFY